MRTFGLMQNAISLLSYAVLLVRFSPWTVVVLLVAGVPAFVAEAKFSGDAFAYFAGARPRRACRSIWRRCWRARITPRR